MPPIVKQTSPTKSTSTTSVGKQGSILSKSIPIQQVKGTWLRFLIYGVNRVGKTHLSAQFPKPLLHIALEQTLTGGALTITEVPGIKYLRLETPDELQQLSNELFSNDAVCDLEDPKYFGKRYATVVIDSATSLQEMILQKITGVDPTSEILKWGKVSRDDYTERSEMTRKALIPFFKHQNHLVIICKERDHNKKDDGKPGILKGKEVESYFAADLGGATVGWVQDGCDYIAQLYQEKETKVEQDTVMVNDPSRPGKKMEKTIETLVETGKIVRRLRTMNHPNFAAGFRSPHPVLIPEYIEDPTFDKIYEIIKGI